MIKVTHSQCSCKKAVICSLFTRGSSSREYLPVFLFQFLRRGLDYFAAAVFRGLPPDGPEHLPPQVVPGPQVMRSFFGQIVLQMPLDLQQGVQALLVGDQGAELLCGFQILHGLDAVDQHRQGLGGKAELFEKRVEELLPIDTVKVEIEEEDDGVRIVTMAFPEEK